MRHLRHLQDAAVDLAVGVFDAAERLHWRIVRAGTALFAPIAAASAIFRRSRGGRGQRLPRSDLGRARIGVLPRVLGAAVGLVVIVAISTALAPSSSSEAVPRTSVGVAGKKASKSSSDGRRARRSASAIPLRVRPVRARAVESAPAVAPRPSTAPAKAGLAAHRVATSGGATRVERSKGSAPVTTPIPSPAPQPAAPAPQPPSTNEENEDQQDGDNSGPGRGDGDGDNGGPGGGGDQGDGGGKDEDDDKGKDKDKDKDKDEEEDDEPEPPPPPDDEDDDN